MSIIFGEFYHTANPFSTTSAPLFDIHETRLGIIHIRYGVVANIVRSHRQDLIRTALGSIPSTGDGFIFAGLDVFSVALDMVCSWDCGFVQCAGRSVKIGL